MRTEVYINDSLIDVDQEEVVAATYGCISFGELNKRKGVKTNTWEAPFSQTNKQVFDSAEISSSDSEYPYRHATIKVDIDGVTVFEGFASLEESEDKYSIQSFAGPSDFYSLITKAKIRDLDLSDFNHIWGETLIKNSWTRTDGYIYAYVHYGKVWGPQATNITPYTIVPEYLLPQVFFHTIIRQIAVEAGYTLQGKVLTNPRFLNHLIVAGVWPVPVSYGSAITLNQVLPDVLQGKVWLDFANMYGLMFDIDSVQKVITCNYIDDIIFNDPEDWTNKVDKSSRQKTRYRYDDFGRTSVLRYKFDEVSGSPAAGVPNATQDYRKEVSIDDDNLEKEQDIYKSDFYMMQVGTLDADVNNYYARMIETKPGKTFYGIYNPATVYLPRASDFVYYNGSYYSSVLGGAGHTPTDPDYWKPEKELDLFVFKSRAMYAALKIVSSSIVTVDFDTPVNLTRLTTSDNMDWEYIYTNHYRVFRRITRKTKRVTKLIKLNYADISQIDFTRAKLIDNELYVLDEVTQYKLNQKDSTFVELVRL